MQETAQTGPMIASSTSTAAGTRGSPAVCCSQIGLCAAEDQAEECECRGRLPGNCHLNASCCAEPRRASRRNRAHGWLIRFSMYHPGKLRPVLGVSRLQDTRNRGCACVMGACWHANVSDASARRRRSPAMVCRGWWLLAQSPIVLLFNFSAPTPRQPPIIRVVEPISNQKRKETR